MALQNDLESLKDLMGRGQMTESPRVLRRLQSGATLGHPGQLSHRQMRGDPSGRYPASTVSAGA